MLTFNLTNDHGTRFEIGRGAKLWRFEPMDREDAEDTGLVPLDRQQGAGRWFGVHRERHTPTAYHHWARLGVAFGSRCWVFTREWPNPDYDTPQAQEEREVHAAQRLERMNRFATRA